MSSRQFYQAGWFKWLAGFVIVLILVPLILRPVLVKVLVDNGFEKASIEKISINWFTGVVAVESLALEREGQPKLSLGLLRIDLDWLALLKGDANPAVSPPSGRLAIVSDGNSPDPDDIGAKAVRHGCGASANMNKSGNTFVLG